MRALGDETKIASEYSSLRQTMQQLQREQVGAQLELYLAMGMAAQCQTQPPPARRQHNST